VAGWLFGGNVGPGTVLYAVPIGPLAHMFSVPRSRSGVARGALTAFRQTGSTLGMALFGSLLAGRGLTGGFRFARVLSAGLLLGVTLMVWGSHN
jgi:hypothetical protein